MSLNVARELWNISLGTNTDILDKKHSSIVENAKKTEFSKFCQNFRNWESQSDSGIPFQVNIYNFKSYGFMKYLKYLISKLTKIIIYKYDEVDYFFDDISIIKIINGYDILEKCPVHKTPGNNLAFFFNKKVSANVRWLRYIYFVSIIRKYINFDSEPKLFLDIGSYYGGFQYVMKHIFKNSRHILVDFPHQLARAAIFLTNAFPKSKIKTIYDLETFNRFFNENKNVFENYDFLLLSIDFYDKFSDYFSKNSNRVDLATNFYSLGEMPEIYFKRYMNSEIMKKSKFVYFCNRYDSSPFYEKTFQESYSLINYLIDGFNIILNRSSGIHNYMMPMRKLFGVKKARPISAGYFELIQKNKS